MLDFTPIREKTTTWPEFVAGYSTDDLAEIVNGYYDEILVLIEDCNDAEVVFQPIDSKAHDSYADNDDTNLAWNLGHVIVHLTASNEEAAFLAAELARGVEFEARRSRFETDWKTVTTMAQCQQRLAESRHMLLASLEIWPDAPCLDNFYTSRGGMEVTPMVRFIFGLSHTDSHLGQIKEIVRQAKEN